MTSQAGKHTIAIDILPNTPGRKCNRTMKFGLLIEYITMRNIFLEKSFTKCGGEKSFSKKSLL